MRIIFVPQYPTPMRYQSWWFWKLPEEFEKAGFEVHVLGKNAATYIKAASTGMFSPVNAAIELECAQVDEYMSLDLRDDDILFLADISFPGFFTNALYHKKPKRCFAFCHATSKNYRDYFTKVHYSKFPVEEAHAQMFKAIFIGSNYHDMKIHWPNAIVTRLPYPPLKTFNEKKKHLIVSASRPNAQKVDIGLEFRIEEKLRYTIMRRDHDNWEDYYKFLSRSRVLLISSAEDTFGYQIVDAVMNNCIPLAPTRCAYPEILPREYLYEDEDELLWHLDHIFNSDDNVNTPVILCHEEMENFYSNIIQVMKGEV